MKHAVFLSHRRPVRISYAFMLLTFVLAGWLHLATPLLGTLFAHLLLTKLQVTRAKYKGLAVLTFLFIVGGVVWALIYFGQQAIAALPAIAEKAIPSVLAWASSKHIELPFSDLVGLKALALGSMKSQAPLIGDLAQRATTELVLLIIGCVVAISMFFNSRLDLGVAGRASPNLYSLTCAQIYQRFATFYASFATVMGAQLLISAINTALTGIFVLAAGLPYALVIIGLTFLCGLLPILGNLASNTVIIGVGFTVSPKMALLALAFLVTVHKLEYFLNSKIIGARIHNPVWLTLLSLVVGERLLGVAGIILAPVVLNYIRVEASQIILPDAAAAARADLSVSNATLAAPTVPAQPQPQPPLPLD